MDAIRQVLIVEDLPDVAQWLRDQVMNLLSPERIEQASTLLQAQEKIREQAYDLALIDLGLPDGSGVELIRPFKEANREAMCVVTTIFDDAEHLFGSLRSGADGYLLKDDTEAEFSDQLSGILAGRPPLSASIARRLLEQFHPVFGEKEVTLTPREKEILTLIAKGLSVKHAAQKLGISHYTAAGYMKDVYAKLQVNTRAEATLKAIHMGLVNPS
ncbi:hisitidine kinase [Alcanivorax sp. P2S70]|uniref:DNA-binding response regulator n=1 Tax=Alcanivorax profundi TaxID=2338368 RepID=A0A418XZE1_9GAMM|nr:MULTISPECIES: response regulator transcription factor [Alcanivorax]ERP89351.1 hisitidine kinase [Alcanivorax sp. P2S70]RJG18404.1 DNA-binding response regulator [Alcanivorax profundi]|tara:strand:+ start:1374 stop:2018 length:645 start_codon:yes stop_codon:yes gene_type:complete